MGANEYSRRQTRSINGRNLHAKFLGEFFWSAKVGSGEFLSDGLELAKNFATPDLQGKRFLHQRDDEA